MEYKVVPLDPTFTVKTATSTSNDGADYLERFIQHYSKQGWEYVRVESISTYVSGDSGCFGIGSTPGYISAKQMVVFKKR
ncbi:hypothetical protein ABV409_02240 [Flagellimonas sp. DF-77]|uniref:hypothetical protein n=1 Tax=Flagellimonas algarum TaxID=3230298 RepID=UPI003394272C